MKNYKESSFVDPRLQQDIYREDGDLDSEGIDFPEGSEPTSYTKHVIERLVQGFQSGRPTRRHVNIVGTALLGAGLMGAGLGSAIGYILGNETGSTRATDALTHRDIPVELLKHYGFQEIPMEITTNANGQQTYSGAVLKPASADTLEAFEEAAKQGQSLTEFFQNAKPPFLRSYVGDTPNYSFPEPTQPLQEGINIITLAPFSERDRVDMELDGYDIQLPNQWSVKDWQIFALFVHTNPEARVTISPDPDQTKHMHVTYDIAEKPGDKPQPTGPDEGRLVFVLNRR